LNQDEFDVALGLIAMEQKGSPMDLSQLAVMGRSGQLPLPNLQLEDPFTMTSTDQEKYAKIFQDSTGGLQGVLAVSQALDLFQKSGLGLLVHTSF
jgi:hypothetical protein